MSTHAHARPGLRVLAVAAAVAALALLAIRAGWADAASVTVLGSSSQTAAPACPQSPCQAIGKVTGFQTSIGNMKKPFLAPNDGRIVAWSLKTSAPDDKQRQFFNDFYGGAPSARISILKPLKSNPLNYKLKSQSPVEDLSSVLGMTTTFTLKTPLAVRAGQVVAITVPTWAPVFAVGLPKGNAWRASRKPSGCTDTDAIKNGSGQEAIGSERTYGCSYTTARLLYSATMIKTAAPPSKKKKKGSGSGSGSNQTTTSPSK